MNDNILDNLNNSKSTNNKSFIRLALIIFSTLIIYFLIEFLRDKFSQNLYEDQQTQINTMGLAIFTIVIINSITIPTILSQIKPKIGVIKITIYTGIILVLIELLFKAIQTVLNDTLITSDSLLNYLKASLIFGIMGASISNIRAHKLAHKKRTIPILISIIVWIAIAFLLKFTN